MRKRSLLAGAMALSLCCFTADALAKKKPKDTTEEAAATAESKPADAANIQVAATAAPTAAPAATPGQGTVRVGVGVSTTPAPNDPAAQRDLAASCAKMISAAADPASQRAIMQTCSQQLGGAQPGAAPAAATEPPSSTAETAPTPAAPPPEPPAAPSGRAYGKAGGFMLNFRLGYVAPLTIGAPTGSGSGSTAFDYPAQGMLGVEFGFSIQQQRKLYLVVPLSFQFQGITAQILLPFGFQYDIALPIRNLYVVPRMTLGYVAQVISINLGSVGGGSTTAVGHAGLINPEIGIKYVLRDRLNLGMDLLSIPIVFSPAIALVSYRVAAYIGANF